MPLTSSCPSLFDICMRAKFPKSSFNWCMYLFIICLCACLVFCYSRRILCLYVSLICSYLSALIARECKDDEAEHAAAHARFLSSLSHVRVRCEGISDSRVWDDISERWRVVIQWVAVTIYTAWTHFHELLPREEIIAQVDSTFDLRFGNTRLFFFFLRRSLTMPVSFYKSCAIAEARGPKTRWRGGKTSVDISAITLHPARREEEGSAFGVAALGKRSTFFFNFARAG